MTLRLSVSNNIFGAVAGAALLLVLACLLHAAPLSAASAVDPYDILGQHIEAVGGLEKLRSIRSSYSSGKIAKDGLQGRFQTWEEKPLRYRHEVDFSVIEYVEGDSGERAWLLDTNSRVLIHRDQQIIKRRQLKKLLEEYEHLDPSSPYFTLGYEGKTAVGGRNCHRLTLANTINSDRLSYCIDADNLLMVKSSYATPDLKTVSVYDDFRTVDGLVLPYHTVTTYSPTEKTEETWIADYTINAEVPAGIFEVPESQKDYSFPEGKASTSATFLFQGDLIYLPVSIEGDTRMWLVDSGASMSVIDATYAEKLGLLKEGDIKGHGFGGTFELGFAAMEKYRVADIVFHRQKVYALDGLQENSYEPVIYGILGYDFLSRFVVEINFDEKKITFYKPESFSYQGTGQKVDAPLKYRTFTLPVKLDSMERGVWSVDIGAHRSSLHYPFAEENNLLDREGVATVSQGAGGYSFGRLSEFGCLRVNDFHLENQLLVIPEEPGSGATAFGEVDGNLGMSTLRNFHLYLDYSKQQIILEKGENFNNRFPRDKSAMLIGESKDGLPMVSYIDETGSAHATGVRLGDVLLAINGIEVNEYSSILGLRQMLKGPAGTAVDLTLLRDGREKEVRLILRDLYDGMSAGCTRLRE